MLLSLLIALFIYFIIQFQGIWMLLKPCAPTFCDIWRLLLSSTNKIVELCLKIWSKWFSRYLLFLIFERKSVSLILVNILRNHTPIGILLQSSLNTCTSILILMPPSRNCANARTFCSTTFFWLPSWMILLRMLGSWFSRPSVASINASVSSIGHLR